MYPFLSSFTYMDKLTEELGIPKYKEENNDTTGFISPTDFMKTYSKKIKRQVDYIIRIQTVPYIFLLRWMNFPEVRLRIACTPRDY